MSENPLRILITCHELAARGGSQLYTRDVAEALRALGHSPVVYSPRLGEVAAELRSRGVAVIDRLEQLGATPDVIHGQHHLTAMAAMLQFPTVPALYVCHGWLPWEEAPPIFPSLTRYVAVDALRRDRLVLENGIPEDRVTVIYNFVDLERFRPRPRLPPRPRRALLLSNAAAPHTFMPMVQRACAAQGIELEVAGIGSGRPVAQPHELLPSFDLVFGRGRAALEAMAVGTAVVLCDIEGCGPLVDETNFARLRDLNFGIGALRPPITEDRLRGEIERYDAEDAARVQERVRREAGRTAAVIRLIDLYRSIIANAPLHEGDAYLRECLAAASVYLRGLGPHGEVSPSMLIVARNRVAVAENRAAAAGAEVAAGALRIAELEEALAAVRTTLSMLERSPFSRLRARLLKWQLLVTAYQKLKARQSGDKDFVRQGLDN